VDHEWKKKKIETFSSGSGEKLKTCDGEEDWVEKFGDFFDDFE
jgi:hypothetical protein